MTFGRLGAVLTVVFALTTPLMAGSIEYTYTGNLFNDFISPYTASDSVTGEFRLSAPLADNMTFSGSLTGNVSPLSFSFTDGIQTLTSSDGLTIIDFDFVTNSSGAITQWYVSVGYSQGGGAGILTSNSEFGVEDYGDMSNSAEVGSIESDPGTWSIGSPPAPDGTVSPEPAAVLLVFGGLLLICVRARAVKRS